MTNNPAPTKKAEVFVPSKEGSGYSLGGHGGASQAAPAPTATPASAPAPKSTAVPEQLASVDPATRAQSAALANAVVASLVDRLKVEATQKGGTLTLQDLENMGAEFQSKVGELTQVFAQSFEQNARIRENNEWDKLRTNVFDRIMVKQFSKLFADGSRLKPENKRISRRMLPGFFSSLNMMLGQDVVDARQEQCTAVVDRIRSERSAMFNWDAVYQDAEIQDIILQSLGTIALHFENMLRRSSWFITLINNQLSPPDPALKADDPGRTWQLDEPTFYNFLKTLLKELEQALSGGPAKAILDRNFSADDQRRQLEIIKKLG